MAEDDTTRIMTAKRVHGHESTSVDTKSVKRGVAETEQRTRIFRPPEDNLSGAISDTDLVVGWLVVIEGPGRGSSHSIGYGINGIGRSSTERISLDFGDEEISRERHAVLIFDHKGRKFFIQHGGGANLSYVSDEPLIQVRELVGREVIAIGRTKLCFIPFCGEQFGW